VRELGAGGGAAVAVASLPQPAMDSPSAQANVRLRFIESLPIPRLDWRCCLSNVVNLPGDSASHNPEMQSRSQPAGAALSVIRSRCHMVKRALRFDRMARRIAALSKPWPSPIRRSSSCPGITPAGSTKRIRSSASASSQQGWVGEWSASRVSTMILATLPSIRHPDGSSSRRGRTDPLARARTSSKWWNRPRSVIMPPHVSGDDDRGTEISRKAGIWSDCLESARPGHRMRRSVCCFA